MELSIPCDKESLVEQRNMTNGTEHMMEMSSSGVSFDNDPEKHSKGNEPIVLLYGGGNETGLRATELYQETTGTVVIADEPEHRQSVTERFGGEVDFLAVNPENQSSVQALAEEFRTEYESLDVLASAKSVASDPIESSEGEDEAYLKNHLTVYRLIHDLREMMQYGRILIPIHPIVSEIETISFSDDTDLTVEAAFARSQYANAAFLINYYIHNWDDSRIINAYDPGIVDHDGSVSEVEQITVSSTPEAGAQRLVHISGSGMAGLLRGGYYQDPVDEIKEQLEDFSDRVHLWNFPTPEFHKLSVSEVDREAVRARDAELCDFDPDWYERDAWWLQKEENITGYEHS